MKWDKAPQGHPVQVDSNVNSTVTDTSPPHVVLSRLLSTVFETLRCKVRAEQQQSRKDLGSTSCQIYQRRGVNLLQAELACVYISVIRDTISHRLSRWSLGCFARWRKMLLTNFFPYGTFPAFLFKGSLSKHCSCLLWWFSSMMCNVITDSLWPWHSCLPPLCFGCAGIMWWQQLLVSWSLFPTSLNGQLISVASLTLQQWKFYSRLTLGAHLRSLHPCYWLNELLWSKIKVFSPKHGYYFV